MSIDCPYNLPHPSFVTVPSAWHLVFDEAQYRSAQEVRVRRWQPCSELDFSHPQLTLVYSAQGILGFRNTGLITPGTLTPNDGAVEIAVSAIQALDPEYAKGLNHLYSRTIFIHNGSGEPCPLYWVKFAHSDGTYAMVSLNINGVICAVDLSVTWDYANNRRGTEEWDNDDWLNAFLHKRPQLAPPHALAY